jgi:hypothetical protein
MLPLTSDQRRRIEGLVRQRGVTCQHCGSTDLSCGDVVLKGLRNFNVDLFCNNRAAHPEGLAVKQPASFNIPFEEAHTVGLPVRGESPRRPPGGTFPTA